MRSTLTALGFAAILALGLPACGSGEETASSDTTYASDAPTTRPDTAVDRGTSERLDAPHDGDADRETPGAGTPPDGGSEGREGAVDRDPEVAGDRSGEAAPPAPSGEASQGSSIAGLYRLESVEGEPLPVTVDENADCRLEIAGGELRIQPDRTFQLRASSRTICDGELLGDEVNTAAGTVAREGNDLRFEASSGEFFATGSGVVTDDGSIRVQQLMLEGEPTPIDWHFVR